MITIRQYSSKQTSVSISTQFFKRGLVDGAKTTPDTATDEGIDALSVGSRGEEEDMIYFYGAEALN